ncbi:MAG: hypothetical protein DME97_12200 [Verrucomicrobia bacterium]|nr:MAG: hypothetical protein DME97_12200 [Verrucomicrobiota bacterium]
MKFGKRKTILIAAIVTIVLVTALWIGLRSGPPATIQGRYDELKLTTSPSASQPHSAMAPVVAASADTTPFTEAERQKAIEQLEATSIVFFGKVVDQNELPVVGARATYTVHHLSFHGNAPVDGPVTDNDGRFEIRTQGPSITVSVSHPQFYEGKDAERQIDYGHTITAHPFSPKPSRESPTLFRLVRKGQAETVIHVPSKEIRLPLDGRSVEINLGANSLAVSIRLHSTSAALEPNEFRHFDWSLGLAVSNGGLVERLNSIDFLAPENGYVPELEIQLISTGSLQWSSRINKEYFVRFANGRYGRFQITVSGETGFCRFESYLNPSGSRNLEVDPAKVVTSSVSRHD